MSHTEKEKREAVGRVARRIRQNAERTNTTISYQDSLTRAAGIARSSERRKNHG